MRKERWSKWRRTFIEDLLCARQEPWNFMHKVIPVFPSFRWSSPQFQKMIQLGFRPVQLWPLIPISYSFLNLFLIESNHQNSNLLYFYKNMWTWLQEEYTDSNKREGNALKEFEELSMPLSITQPKPPPCSLLFPPQYLVLRYAKCPPLRSQRTSSTWHLAKSLE